MRSRTLTTVVVLMAVAIAAAFLFPPARRGLFCSQIINPFKLNGGYTVSVPSDKHEEFNAKLAHLLQRKGLSVSSGQMSITDSGDSSVKYLDTQSIACDGRVFVWSGNDLHRDEFVVTFYDNSLFAPGRAEDLRLAFASEFGSRYRLSNKIGWQSGK